MKIARREQNIIMFQNFSVNSKAEEYTLDPFLLNIYIQFQILA